VYVETGDKERAAETLETLKTLSADLAGKLEEMLNE